MKIKRLTLKNFRAFYGQYTMSFGQKNIIYGLNGYGKTSILCSFFWLLYGNLGFREVKDDPDENLCNNLAESEGAYDVSVAAEIEFRGRTYYLKRNSLSKEDWDGKLNISEIRNGSHFDIEHENPEFINAIIPKYLMPYFFFGEDEVTKLLSSHNENTLRMHVQDILGTKLFDTSLNILKKMITDYSTQISLLGENSEKSKRLNRDLESASSDHDNAIKLVAEKQKQLNDKQEKVRDIRNKLKAFEAAKKIMEKIENLEQQKKDIKKELTEKRETQIEYFAQNTGFILSQKILNTMEHVEDERFLPSPYNEMLIEDIKKDKKCICGRDVEPGSKEFRLIETLKQKASTTIQFERLGRIRTLRHDLNNRCLGILERYDKYANSYEDCLEKLNNNENAQKDNRSRLQHIDDGKIQDLEKDEHSLAESIGGLKNEIQGLIKDKDGKEKTYKRVKAEMDRHNDKISSADADVLKTKKKHLEQAKEWMENKQEIEKKAAQEYVENLMNKTLEKYFREPWKVAIDPDTWNIKITDEKGQPKDGSSGQNQFLGLAFSASLVNLAREKKSVVLQTISCPLVLDSIYGKLDDDGGSGIAGYTENVTKFIFDLGDQVILLLTNAQSKHIPDTIDKNSIDKQYVITAHQDTQGTDIFLYNNMDFPLIKYGQKNKYSEVVEFNG